MSPMGSHATPMNFGKQSSMATALQNASGNERPRFSHRDSVNAAAQPISMSDRSNQNKPRRESLASSMVTGMSWGGASVGSWIRDDIIMQGTSPFTYQSPSFHSSSYQPKLEADFMRDFSCCNLRLATLHDLLEHYEENHSQQLEELNRRTNEGPRPDPKAAIASNTAAALKDPAQAQQQQQARQRQAAINQQNANQHNINPSMTHSAHPNYPSQVEETVGDMEMDDDFQATAGLAPQYQIPNPPPTNVSQFGRPPAPRLDMSSATNGNNALLQHQGLRQSTPTTPVSAGGRAYYQNNPTVSSVNTPTLTAHPAHQLQQQQQFFTPDSSAPGTPGEIDPDVLNNMSAMNMSYLPPTAQPSNYDTSSNPWGYPSTQQQNEMLELCIDEPAKRLFQANGIYNNNNSSNNATSSNGNGGAGGNAGGQNQAAQSTSAQQLGDNQYTEDSDLARTIREQQKLAGVPDPSADGVPKPFHCPVIGCEKAYKNQNGLKYHKSHGHNTQTLHSNPNGTFSIVDPETLQPYPGTKGMEKHKPYQCQTCGKRYKNLNGLKYHKSHTQSCDPEIKLGEEVPVSGGAGGNASGNNAFGAEGAGPKTNSRPSTRERELGFGGMASGSNSKRSSLHGSGGGMLGGVLAPTSGGFATGAGSGSGGMGAGGGMGMEGGMAMSLS